ncbi:MAG: PorT family protein [Dysgonamonadaceae bacterium]|nr:PorT family protein [Dysgonamonadaceae bacterium]
MTNKILFLKQGAIILLLCFPSLRASAENTAPSWEFKINAGYNLGATSPLSLPAEIRKIEKYSPSGIAPHFALEATRWLNEKWGISAQMTLDHKGFTVRDEVKSLHTEIDMKDEKFTGNFTGKNTTEIRNVYLSLPVLATRRISDKWLVQAGFYLAYLYHPHFNGSVSGGSIRKDSPIGEKTLVDHASFDFSKEQNALDYGVLLAGERVFYSNFALRGQLSWGLKPLFPSGFTGITFKMYNIYGLIGISYRLNI